MDKKKVEMLVAELLKELGVDKKSEAFLNTQKE
jgi:hypothetical protein